MTQIVGPTARSRLRGACRYNAAMVNWRDGAYALAAGATSPIWLARMCQTGKLRTDWAGRFGKVGQAQGPGPATDRQRWLIHAVSVGEVNAIRQLVDNIAERYPPVQPIIATTTNTGFARASSLFADRFPVVRYPMDFSFAVDRLLSRIEPSIAISVELEVWPNFIEACSKRGIPVAVVNGRLSARSFKRYRIVKGLIRNSFASLSAVGCQTQAYAQRFIDLGTPADRVHVLDTMKWDTARIEDHVDGADALATAMGLNRDKPIVVAGSTAPGEHALLTRAIKLWPADTQLVMVPRKPEWFDQAAQEAEQAYEQLHGSQAHCIRRSHHPGDSPRQLDDKRLFLIDTMGELRQAYALATVAVVGRSFVKLFGSDMIEPISLGKPTVIGPNYSDFADTISALLAGDGICVAEDPGPAVAALLQDPGKASRMADAGRNVILSRQGATLRHIAMLAELTNNNC